MTHELQKLSPKLAIVDPSPLVVKIPGGGTVDMSSQEFPSSLKKNTKITITSNGQTYTFISDGEVVTFNGYEVI